MDRETPRSGGGDGGLGRGRLCGAGYYNTCIGHYSYHKWIDEELSLPVIVAVFPIEVLRIDDDFPEAGQRKRKWLSPKKAARTGGRTRAWPPVDGLRPPARLRT